MMLIILVFILDLNNMATFNQQILDTYFKNRDWTGAADYLSTLTASSAELQNELNLKIKELRRQGSIQEAMLQNMNSNQQAAFNFISAYDGGMPLPKNTYGNKYSSLLNDLKVIEDVISPGGRNVKGESINTLRIELNTDSEYARYLSKLGMSKDEIADKDVSVRKDSSTGKWIVDIPKDNIYISNFYVSALDLDTTYKHPTTAGSFTQTIKGNYSIKGLTSSNIIVNENQFNKSNLYDAYGIVRDARNEQNKAIENNQTVNLQEDIIVTPFLGHGHANAYKRMAQGAISIDDYKKIVEERTNVYNTLLKQVGLENYNVYTTQPDDNDKEGKVFKQIDDKDKDEIMQMILIAMDDKRLTYSAAIHDGEVGTYITISGATDKDKNIVSGDYGQPIRIFVPGLFKSSCDEAFDADTKQAAVRDNADMRRWNYGKFLKDGSYVGYDKEIGAYTLLTDDNGNQVKVPVSTEQMLQALNKENIIDNSVNVLLSNIDSEGNPLTYTKDGKQYTYDIEERAQILANVATNELYPKGIYSDGKRLKYANDLYNVIMSELSKNFYKRKEK